MLVTSELAPVGLSFGRSRTEEPDFLPDPETASEVVWASLAYAKCIAESYQALSGINTRILRVMWWSSGSG